jgi:hypothetical protein
MKEKGFAEYPAEKSKEEAKKGSEAGSVEKRALPDIFEC